LNFRSTPKTQIW